MNPTRTNFGEDEPHGVFAFSYASDYDPVSRKVYLESTMGFYEYDYDANTWTKLVDIYSLGGTWSERTGVVVPTRRIFVSVADGRVAVYGLDAPSYELWTTTGGAALVGALAPGLAYDPTTDGVVGWANGSVYRLDLDTRAWTAVGTPFTSQDPYADKIYGRWAYLPAEDAFLVVPGVEEDARVFKNSP